MVSDVGNGRQGPGQIVVGPGDYVLYRALGAGVPAGKGRAGREEIATKLLGLTCFSTADEYLHQGLREPPCLLQLICRVINSRIECQLAVDLKCTVIIRLGLGPPLGHIEEKAESPLSQRVGERGEDLRVARPLGQKRLEQAD